METALGRPTRTLQITTPLVLTAAGAWLLAQLVGPRALATDLSVDGLAIGLFSSLLAPWLVLGAALRAWATTDPEARRRRLDEATLIPCVLAPLAVVAPWVIAPTPFGFAPASLPFFVGWLTRYPTVAGVNHEVLLGMGAVLGASALPAFSAFHVACTRAPRAGWIGLFVVLQLVAYVPVLVELDLATLAHGAAVAQGVPTTIFGPSQAAWWQDIGSGLMDASGALMRLMATVSMISYFVRVARRSGEPSSVWEMS